MPKRKNNSKQGTKFSGMKKAKRAPMTLYRAPTAITPEKKYYHTHSNGTANISVITSSSAVIKVASMNQGAGEEDRIANKLRAHYLRVRFFMDNYGTNFNSAFLGKVAIVIDKQQNGLTTVAPSDIWKDNTGWEDRSVAYKIASGNQRFQVLKEMDYHFFSAPADGTPPDTDTRAPRAKVIQGDWFVKIPQELSTITYAASAGAPITNGLYFIVYGEAATSTDVPNIGYSTTLCFSE